MARLTMLGWDYGFNAYGRGGPRRYSYAYAPATLGAEDNGEEKKEDPVWLRTLNLLADKGAPVAEKYLESQIAKSQSEMERQRFRSYLTDVRAGRTNGGFSFDMNEAMPWIIGGVVVLVAGSVIMGTRRRRR